MAIGRKIVYKVKPGVYLVVNFARVDATCGMLFVNWGRFWDRMTNEKLQLPMIKKCCPVLYEVMTGGDKDGMIEMEFGVSAMRKKMLTIYNELVKNPPFPAWKSGLDEVWE